MAAVNVCMQRYGQRSRQNVRGATGRLDKGDDVDKTSPPVQSAESLRSQGTLWNHDLDFGRFHKKRISNVLPQPSLTSKIRGAIGPQLNVVYGTTHVSENGPHPRAANVSLRLDTCEHSPPELSATGASAAQTNVSSRPVTPKAD